MADLEDVYCTLLLNDSYLPGASVLAHSLRDAGTTKKLAVLVTLDTLSADTITQLKALYDYILPVEPVRNPNPSNLYLMGRPDLAYAFTKIALWRQTQFRKIVYLDADVVVLRALDELFDLDAFFAAAPDVGWPDAFNTGVMVLTPNMGEYWALQTMAASGDSFDGADQGLLNQYYEHRPWHRLSFAYNCTPNAQYQWEPAYRYYKRGIAAVHFIGKDKPWNHARRPGSGVHSELLGRWWAVHDRHLQDAKATAPGRVGGAQGPGQDHGSGETASTILGTPAAHHLTSIPEVVEPEAPVTTTEPPLSEPPQPGEVINQGVVEPTPTVPERKFSPPQMEWDATISEPPLQSKPEAADFPSQTYTFSESHALFNPPPAYPEPPKDMWYEVPESKPQPEQKPKPIFPWEMKRDQPRATRVFAEDFQPERKRSVLSPLASPPMASGAPPTASAVTTSTQGGAAAEPTSSSKPAAHQFHTVHYNTSGGSLSELEVEAGEASPPQVASPKSSDEQWQEFQESNVNAWDDVPGIGNYVRAIIDAQTRRSKPQVLYSENVDLGSPAETRQARRESLILTEFPSAVERPSLPVTPAPIRRPTFWGEERDGGGDLPAAEGVPDQTEWVCPQCGFFSVSAADFHQRRRSLSSSSTAVPSLSLTTSFATVVDIAPQPAEKAKQVMKPPPAKHSIQGNPEEMLEQLRRTSLLEFEHLKLPDHPQPPLRELPEHSVPTSSMRVQHHVGPGSPLGGFEDAIKAKDFAPGRDDKPVFKALDFGGDGTNEGEAEKSRAEEGVEGLVSPTAEE